MAIKITEDGAVRYVNENDVDRTMFPNLTGAMGDEQYDALNGRLTVVEGKVSDLEECCGDVNNDINELKNDLSDKADKSEALSAYIVETATGSIASFTDGADDVPVKDLTVAIEPVQDLHGYDHPWPAGGGKNKVNFSNLTIEANVDKQSNIGSVVLPAGTYTFSYTLSATVTATRNRPLYLLNGVSYYGNDITTAGRGSWTFTLEEQSTLAFTWWQHTVSAACTISDFQLEKGSVATTYAPYSNICPISGWTGANVTACGVNVWNEEWEVGGIDWSTGNNTAETDRIRSKGYIPVKPNTSYWFSSKTNKYLWMYDESKTLITNISDNNNFLQLGTGGQLFTTKSNCYYVRFIMWITYGTTYNHDISINYPSTDHDYHAYNGSSVSVDWTTEAGTVYGGTLDVTTGVLTVDRAIITMDGTQSIGNNGTLSYGGIQVVTTPSPAKKLGATNAEGLLSDKFKIADIAEPYTLVGRTSNANLIFNMPTDVTSIELAKTWFTNNPTQVSYLLATPQTFQLTAHEVSTILGQNNIFADTGNSTVQYRADTRLYIDKVLNT